MAALRRVILIVLMHLLICPSVYGQDKPSDSKKWQFEFTPYVWLPSVNADITVGAATVDVDIPFSDIWDNFDVFSLAGRFEAWKGGRWGLILDGIYIVLDTDTGGANLETDLVLIDYAAGYRVAEVPLGSREESSTESKSPALWFDAIGGLRYGYFKAEITLRASGPIIGERSITLRESEDWVEPFIGGRIGVQVTEKFSLEFRGDVGGFGLGSATDLTWNFIGGIDYRPWKLASFKLAYRVLGIDYEQGSGSDKLGLDGIMHGPLLGLTFYF